MAKTLLTPLTIIAVSISASLAGFAPVTYASEDDRIKQLEQRIDALEADLIEAKDAAKKVDRVKFSSKTPAPEFVSKDGRSTMNFKGRIQTDYVHADDMYTGKKRELEEGFSDTSIRRLRFGVEGYFARDWEYEIEFDFADNEVDLKDANVTYKGWDDSQLVIGFQKYAFGMESTQSSSRLVMLERSVVDRFAPDRAVGLQYRYVSDNFAAHLGYGVDFGVDDSDEDDVTNPKLSVVNARITGTPIASDGHLLHLGASLLYSHHNDDALETRYRARPSSRPTGRIIDTGKFDAESTMHYGLEAAYQYRGLRLQTEYVKASADQVEDPSIDVDAYYLMASYVLTGEKWGYKNKKGTFKAIRPNKPLSEGGLGAWEIALRMDQANFSDASADIDGGEMTDYVLGLNWYMEDNLKLQLNYVYAEAEYDNPQSNMDDATDQDTNIIQARLQFAF